VHIHVNVRIFDASGNVTIEATTQLFFDDATDGGACGEFVVQTGTRDVLNAADSTCASENPALLVSLTGTASTSYAGTVAIGIAEGAIFGGYRRLRCWAST
jgi:hypothetical protein